MPFPTIARTKTSMSLIILGHYNWVHSLAYPRTPRWKCYGVIHSAKVLKKGIKKIRNSYSSKSQDVRPLEKSSAHHPGLLVKQKGDGNVLLSSSPDRCVQRKSFWHLPLRGSGVRHFGQKKGALLAGAQNTVPENTISGREGCMREALTAITTLGRTAIRKIVNATWPSIE